MPSNYWTSTWNDCPDKACLELLSKYNNCLSKKDTTKCKPILKDYIACIGAKQPPSLIKYY